MEAARIKMCTRCGEGKELSEFYKHSQKPNCTQSECKVCNKRAATARRLSDPKKFNEGQKRCRLAKYGLTKDDFNALLEKQNGGCAICGATSGGKRHENERLHVDHCHTTGVVRGLLCTECNTSLGKFKDSPELLRKAAMYLEQSRRGQHG